MCYCAKISARSSSFCGWKTTYHIGEVVEVVEQVNHEKQWCCRTAEIRLHKHICMTKVKILHLRKNGKRTEQQVDMLMVANSLTTYAYTPTTSLSSLCCGENDEHTDKGLSHTFKLLCIYKYMHTHAIQNQKKKTNTHT